MRNNTPQPDPDPRRGGSRLNLLLTYGGWRRGAAVEQLPRLLTPMGICSVQAASGEEAAEVIRTIPIHIAVVDLAIPLQAGHAGSTVTAGGARILQLLRRLDPSPPTVVVRPPRPIASEHARELSQSLREGAFAVVDRPLALESMLEILRRVLRRHYADLWPTTHTHGPRGTDAPAEGDEAR